jgi:hypothetical protein
MKSGCMRTAQFSLKPASILNATTVLRILEINARSLPRSRKESHSGTDFRLFYLITILFATNLLFYIALCVRQISPRVCLRRPLYTFVICIAVSKRV